MFIKLVYFSIKISLTNVLPEICVACGADYPVSLLKIHQHFRIFRAKP